IRMPQEANVRSEEVEGDPAENGPALAPTLPDPSFGPSKRRHVPPSLAARYEDIRFVGEGGWATVYRAMDARLRCGVAAELLKWGDLAVWRRFSAEARAQAGIVHDNVCRVYEAGEADGEPYIAMQFIDGRSLVDICDQLTRKQCVTLLKVVSAAVHEAHRMG